MFMNGMASYYYNVLGNGGIDAAIVESLDASCIFCEMSVMASTKYIFFALTHV